MAKIKAYDWVLFAAECGIQLNLLMREMLRMSKLLYEVIQLLQTWSGYNDEEKQLIDKVSKFCLSQADQLTKHAKLLPEVKLD